MIVDPLRGARQVLCQAWIQSIVYYFNCRQKLSSSLGVQTEHNYNMDVTVTMPAYYSLLCRPSFVLFVRQVLRYVGKIREKLEDQRKKKGRPAPLNRMVHY